MRYLILLIFSFLISICQSQNLAELILIDRKPINAEIISINDSIIFYKKVRPKKILKSVLFKEPIDGKILEMERYKAYKINYIDEVKAEKCKWNEINLCKSSKADSTSKFKHVTTVFRHLKPYKVSYINNPIPRSVIVYIQDTIEGNTLSNEQMAFYMMGQEDAYRSYKNKNFFPFLFGFSAGFGAPALGFVYGPLVPIGAITAQGFFPIKQKKSWGFNPEYSNNEFYIGGYERVIRRKNIRRVAWSSLVGFVSGTVVLSQIIRANN